MLFVETPIFTKQAHDLLPDDELAQLQLGLVVNPHLGAVIPGTRGLRKIRWGSRGRGKRGGTRTIYYWQAKHETIYMLYIYDKRRQSDLTPVQLRTLSRSVREELG